MDPEHVALALIVLGCSSTSTNPGAGGADSSVGGSVPSGGVAGTGGVVATGGSGGVGGVSGAPPDGSSGGSESCLSIAGTAGATGACPSADLFGQCCKAGAAYCDDFIEDPAAIFLVINGSWTWDATKNTYKQVNQPSQSTVWVGARSEWSTYAVETRVSVDSAAGIYANAGIILRIVDPGLGAANTGQMYYYGIGPNEVVFGSISNGWTLLYTDKTTHPIQTGYTLRVEATDGSFKLFLDGKLLNTISDSSFTTGGIGLRTYDATATYDYVAVSCY